MTVRKFIGQVVLNLLAIRCAEAVVRFVARRIQ